MWYGRQFTMYNLKEEGNHHPTSKEVRMKRLHLRSNCVVCGCAVTKGLLLCLFRCLVLNVTAFGFLLDLLSTFITTGPVETKKRTESRKEGPTLELVWCCCTFNITRS